MVAVDSQGQLSGLPEAGPIQDPAQQTLRVQAAEKPCGSGHQEDIPIVGIGEEAYQAQKPQDIKGPPVTPEPVIHSRCGEAVGQYSNTQGGEGPKQGNIEGPPVFPQVYPGPEEALDHQNGCREEDGPGQRFLLPQQSEDKISGDQQGGQLPQGIVDAVVEEHTALQQQQVRDLVVDAPNQCPKTGGGRGQNQGDRVPGEDIQEKHGAGEEIVGIDLSGVVQGVVPGAVGLRLPFVEGLPKKKAGENEKHLHRHRGPRRDGQAAVEKGDDVAEQELDEIQRIASLLLHI